MSASHVRLVGVAILTALLALGSRVAAAGELTTLACRDREDPSMGATLVFDLERRLLVRSAGSGPTIFFDDRDVRVHVDDAAIEWEVAHNTYTLNRATLELDVAGRVYICQLARKQI